MPRPSRHRGKEVKKRGISKEQVCVGTALDREGNIIIELLCTSRVTANALERLYRNRIGENSILCTDSLPCSYTKVKDFKTKHPIFV